MSSDAEVAKLFYQCIGCGDNDLHNLVDDQGSWVCICCGFVHGDYPVLDEHPSVVAKRPKIVVNRGDRNTYVRKAHMVERLNLAVCREPCIPTARCATIYNFWRGSGTPLPTNKSEIRMLLRSLDKQKVDTSFPYCQKYLEKWKSIRRFIFKLEGVEIDDQPDTHVLLCVGTVFDRMSKVWTRWQPRRLPRSQWRFPERKHFPSFNLVIVRIHQMLNLPYDPDDWPLPGTECIKKVTKYIDAMLEELKLPVYPLKELN